MTEPMVSVPREPDHSMLCVVLAKFPKLASIDMVRKIYDVMLSAAPPAPAHDAKVRAVVEAARVAAENIGWRGFGEEDTRIYYCEFCQAHHEDSDHIEHTPGCLVTQLRAALAALAEDSGFMEKSEDHPGHTDLMVTPESLDKWLRSRAGRRT